MIDSRQSSRPGRHYQQRAAPAVGAHRNGQLNEGADFVSEL